MGERLASPEAEWEQLGGHCKNVETAKVWVSMVIKEIKWTDLAPVYEDNLELSINLRF